MHLWRYEGALADYGISIMFALQEEHTLPLLQQHGCFPYSIVNKLWVYEI